MAKRNQLQVGQRWAYRVGSSADLDQVEVIAVDHAQLSRVSVAFHSGFQRGEASEVPIARLKVLWSDRAEFLDAEQAWLALASTPDMIESEAVEALVGEFLWPAAVYNTQKSRRATISILDDEIVDVITGGGLSELIEGAASLVEKDGTAHYGWNVAIEIARRLCAHKPQRVMAYVHSQEAEGQNNSLTAAGWRAQTAPDPYRVAARETASYEKFLRPMCNLIRSWCGANIANTADELRDARSVAVRFVDLLEAAVALLADAGDVAGSRAIYCCAFPKRVDSDWEALITADAIDRRRWHAGLHEERGCYPKVSSMRVERQVWTALD